MIRYTEGVEFQTIFPSYIDEILKHQNLSCVYDLGCNVGAFVNLINNKTDKKCKVIGFEPDIDNYNFLISQNYPNLIAYNLGIFYGKEEARVTGIGDNNTGGYMVEDIQKDHLQPHINNIQVYQNKIFKLSVLEDFIEQKLPLNLVKIDVEASEYNIIENSKILKEFDWLIIEFHNHNDDYYREYIAKQLPNYKIVGNQNPFLLKKI